MFNVKQKCFRFETEFSWAFTSGLTIYEQILTHWMFADHLILIILYQIFMSSNARFLQTELQPVTPQQKPQHFTPNAPEHLVPVQGHGIY